LMTVPTSFPRRWPERDAPMHEAASYRLSDTEG